jgi:hypothetical protein
MPNKSVVYPCIGRVIRHVLALPYGTAGVERDFSLVNIIKNKLRNKLNTDTLEALLRVREFIPKKFSSFEPTERMFSLMNSAIYKKKITDTLTQPAEESDDIIEIN